MTIVFIDFQDGVDDLNVSANESIFFSLFVCRMAHKNVQKMLLNVDSNAKIVIESELCANARFLAPMNVSSLYWSPFHENESVFCCNEQQKV